MAKFANTKAKTSITTAKPVSHIKQKTSKPIRTALGGPGFERGTKSELFLLAISNMVGESTFHESADARDARFVELIDKVAKKDPEWLQRFIPWLRNTANMRSASVVAAAEYVASGAPGGRKVIDSALSRADEPAELLAYWIQYHYGWSVNKLEKLRYKPSPKLPSALRKGLADAANRLYTPRSWLKYSGKNQLVGMGNVLELVHPVPVDAAKSELFKYIVDEHSDKPTEIEPQLIANYNKLNAMTPAQRKKLIANPAKLAESFKQAGMTWESVSGWVQGPMTAEIWEAIIPNMGYMALLRNLRNFDQAGISAEVRKLIIAKLTDPDEVAKSRQFPIRFYSAYRELNSLNWSTALDEALGLSLSNIPEMSGKSLIMTDDSGSMGTMISGKSSLQLRDLAKLFGAALAVRSQSADLVAYGSTSKLIDFNRSDSVLNIMQRMSVGGGTETLQTLNKHYSGHDRVIIVTDEQAMGASSYVRSNISHITCPIYVFNVAGYKASLAINSNTVTIGGGLTDAAFKTLDILEKYQKSEWPF